MFSCGIVIFCQLYFLPYSSQAITPLTFVEENAQLDPSGRYLFWSDISETPISKIPKCGGEAYPLAFRMGVPVSFTMNGDSLYWIDQRTGISPSGSCTGPGVIWRLNRTSLIDGTTTLLDTGDNCSGGTADIVVDSTSVYWVTSTASPNSYTIRKGPTSGGTFSTFITSSWYRIAALAADVGNVYWAEDRFPDPDYSSSIKRAEKNTGSIETVVSGIKAIRGNIIVQGGFVYFADSNYFDTLRVMKSPVAGGGLIVLATIVKGSFDPVNDIEGLTVDESAVFWADRQAIRSVPITGGTIRLLANLDAIPTDIEMDADHVYWSETSGPAAGETGKISSVLKSGGEIKILRQGGDAPQSIKLVSSSMYWAEGGDIGEIGGFGRIAKMSISGGADFTVMSGISTSDEAQRFVVSDDYVYVADKFRIKRVSVRGGNTETLFLGDFEITDIALDETSVYWIEAPFSTVRRGSLHDGSVSTLAVSGSGGPPGPMRVKNGFVYWIDGFDAIRKVSAAGGAVVTLASDLPFLNDLEVDDGFVYFSEHDTGALRRMTTDGASMTLLAAQSAMASPRYLAIDSQYLYWIDQQVVGRVPGSGGVVQYLTDSVFADPYQPGSIAVDSTGVYWTETGFSIVMKQPSALVDTDGDCVPDIEDTFPDNQSEWQDTDGDGTGDQGDIDDDGDDIPDLYEEAYMLNPMNGADADFDRDGDNLSNRIEFFLGTDPYAYDSDNDGLSDGDEDQNANGIVDPLETNPLLADTDGDGLTDSAELECGSNPANMTSKCGTALPWLMLLLGD